MISADKSNEERRAVEALAQSLYEAQDQGGIAWAKRTLVIREPWLLLARRQRQAAEGNLSP